MEEKECKPLKQKKRKRGVIIILQQRLVQKQQKIMEEIKSGHHELELIKIKNTIRIKIKFSNHFLAFLNTP